MQKFILPVLVAVLCGISFLLLLRDREKHPVREGTENTDPSIYTKPMLVYSAVMIVLTVAASFLFNTVYATNHIFTSMKRLTLLSVMWPVAYIDYKTYRIPNAYILFGLACRALLIPFEWLYDADHAKYALISEGVAACAMLLASVLCAVCSKGSLGFGDIKLFVVMGLLLGTEGIWGAVFVSLVISFFAAVFLLVTRRKNRKDAIPFGPAIVIGTYISVCLTGM